MNSINILHLSDLHIGKEDKDGAVINIEDVVDDLCKKIEILPEEWKPKYIAISGDIAFKGNMQNYKLATPLIKKIIGSTGITNKKRIIIAPGNHDKFHSNVELVNRAIDTERSKDEQKIKKNLDSKDNSQLGAEINQSFHYYNKFCSDTLKIEKYNSFYDEDNFTFGIRDIPEDKIIFVVVNSCWATYSGFNDYGRLFLGNRIIKELYKQLKGIKNIDEYCIVTVMHHGKNWFRWDEKYKKGETFQTNVLLESFSDIILVGHEHGSIVHPDFVAGKSLVFYGGAIYTNPDLPEDHFHSNNCSIIKVDTKNFIVKVKTLIYQKEDIEDLPAWDLAIKNENEYYLKKGIELLKHNYFLLQNKHTISKSERIIIKLEERLAKTPQKAKREPIIKVKLPTINSKSTSNIIGKSYIQHRIKELKEEQKFNENFKLIGKATAKTCIFLQINAEFANYHIAFIDFDQRTIAKVIEEKCDNYARDNMVLNLTLYLKDADLGKIDKAKRFLEELKRGKARLILQEKLIVNKVILLEL